MWQRWNGTTKIFEKSTDSGATWAPLDLDAAIITQGALAKARQHAQTAYLDASNVFTADQVISKTRPVLRVDTGATIKSRFYHHTDASAEILNNLSHDGTNWNLDDTGNAGSIILSHPSVPLRVMTATAGTNPRTPSSVFEVSPAGLVTILGQIKFPAVQNASADVNTLDDYEEGNWTPIIGGSGGESGQAYSAQTGTYVKLGKLVTFAYDVTLSTKGTITGTVTVKGLPFTAAGVNSSAHIGYWSNLGTNWYVLLPHVQIATTGMIVYGISSASGPAATVVGMVAADVTDTTRFMGSGHYYV